jgi:hypothetical protein
MSLKDAHVETRVESLELTVLLFNHGMVEEQHLSKLICSLFVPNKKLNAAVKPLWIAMWNDEWYPTFVDGLKDHLDESVIKLACFSKCMSTLLFDHALKAFDLTQSGHDIIHFYGETIKNFLSHATDALKEDLSLYTVCSLSFGQDL